MREALATQTSCEESSDIGCERTFSDDGKDTLDDSEHDVHAKLKPSGSAAAVSVPIILM
jgi:hypothetical protein